MDFEDLKKEKFIRSVLKKLSQQRIALILQPGNVWVIEKAVSSEDEEVAAALKTCHIRGWVEPIMNAIPGGNLNPDGSLPEKLFTHTAPLYRITEGGWSAINRTHYLLSKTFWVAFATLIATIVGVIIMLYQR